MTEASTAGRGGTTCRFRFAASVNSGFMRSHVGSLADAMKAKAWEVACGMAQLIFIIICSQDAFYQRNANKRTTLVWPPICMQAP